MRSGVHVCPASEAHSLCATGSTGYIIFGVVVVAFVSLLGFNMGFRNLFHLVWPWWRPPPPDDPDKQSDADQKDG